MEKVPKMLENFELRTGIKFNQSKTQIMRINGSKKIILDLNSVERNLIKENFDDSYARTFKYNRLRENLSTIYSGSC
ncbi:hypothetical protein BpHYR1_007662 [Brachionus plicatilis]|uniref:RNA-directed DNA polymerase from mobile element jockey-like n=1 Tax=Brachionus plicatilis TaxID=10195 RepID=A0A3M7TAY8_BRAPC|nr:hypothetical protein BpHYR1_007662 [Brachionus plicatilis]